jgi:endonuclease/exonuclease/phosphatase (EEP) superfamily protein YafD
LASKKDNYVVTGDLNATPDSYLVPKIEKLLSHAGPKYEVKTWTTKPFSYNGFDETELNWRLDYVFATSDVCVVSSEVVPTEYSDHLPIITQLSVG